MDNYSSGVKPNPTPE